MKKFLYIFYAFCCVFTSKTLFAQISGPTNVCVGQTYTYTYTAGGDCFINWSASGGTIVGDPTTFTTANFPATVQIKWTYSGFASVSLLTCSGYYFTLNTSPQDFSLSISPSAPTILYGSSVTLSSNIATSYLWTCNTNSCISGSVTGQNVLATPSVNTTYTVTAKMNFSINQGPVFTCTKSASTNVTVAANPITYNAICCDQSFCGAGDPTVIGQSTGTTLSGGVTPYTYQWQISIDGGTNWSVISGATASTYDPGVIATKSLYRRIVNPGASQSISVVVTKNVMPNTINLGSTTYSSNTSVKANQTVNITGNIATASGIVDVKAGNYLLVNPGSLINSTAILRIEACSNGQRLTVHELNEEASKQTQEVTINIPVYPNPISEGTLYFGRNAVEYQLLNSIGSVIKEGNNVSSFDVNGLNKGIYFLRIDGWGSKIIIQ